MSLHRCFIKAIGLYFWSMCAGVQLQPQKYPTAVGIHTHHGLSHKGFLGISSQLQPVCYS